MIKTAVITGASGGIGAETARVFAENGYSVVIVYNGGKERAETLERELTDSGYSAFSFKADIRDKSQIKNLYEEVDRRYGGIGVLVCNAGIAKQQVATDVTDEDWNEIMGVNSYGVFGCCREVIPYMLRSHEGSIVTVSSMWGISGASCESVYSASKAAVIGLTKSLAKELGPSGIRVNCVAPGVIDTAMNSAHSAETMKELAEDTSLCRIGKPREVAEAIYFLASEKASFITGQVLSVDGGFII